MTSKDGHMVLSTSSKKDLGVVTSLVTAERERVRVPFFAHASPFFVRGFWEFLHIFYLCLI